MTISKSVIDKLNRTYRFNMVNLENEKFKNLGLKPLYLTVQPQYINLQNNIFYNTEIAIMNACYVMMLQQYSML